MRRIPIRMKLAGALAVPLVALVVVTMLEVVQSARDVDRVREQSALAASSSGPASLLSRLEDERNAAAVYLLGQEESFGLPVEDNAEAREITDEALTSFRGAVDEQGGDIAAAYGPALDGMSGLEDLRNAVDTAPGERNLANITTVSEVFDGYTALMDPIFDANKRVALAVDDPDLRRGAELVDLSSRQTNLIAIIVRDLLLAAVSPPADGLNSSAEVSNVAGTLSELRDNEQLIATKSSNSVYRGLAEELFADEDVQRFPQLVDAALAGEGIDLDGIISTSAGEDPETYGYTIFRGGVTDTLDERATELEDAAVARQRWFIALAVVTLVVAIAITLIVSRSITRPLRSLTRQAKEMAERRLPDAVLDILETPLGDDVQVPQVDPVVVNTRDEVADVSAALNTVQDTALDLAVEQAVLRRNIADSFVNLGRRNQNLLGRQLDFITELETNETDPDTLSNLFRLDHLATRMRRNAESLLVLAGIEPPRKWAAPVRLTDVIRAALGEVEDYQRVTVRGVEPATIIGSAAADLAHLLAELIENALVFSPPDQTVDIRGRQNPNGYTLAVIDSGLGMPAQDVTNANRRLAGAESFTIAPSKYLGHYVAGNLAHRHNIHVTLDNSPGNGITATIDLPPTLLTGDDEELAPEITPPHGNRPVLLPPAAKGAGSRGAGLPAAPAGPLAALAGAPAAPSAPPPRTQSGLVKRNAGDSRPSTIGADRPSGDLLADLSRHATNLHGGAPATAPGRPTNPWTSPARGNGGDQSAPPLARRRPGPEGPNGPNGPRPAPPHAPGPSVPPPPLAMPPAPPTPSGPASTGGPAEGGITSGGLARRVRGAQLPATQPLQLRRSGDAGQARQSGGPSARPPGPPPAPGPSAAPQGGLPSRPVSGLRRGVGPMPTPPLPTPRPPTSDEGSADSRRRADDVYTFLSSFTAGVQRGLQADPPRPNDRDDPRPPG